MLYYYSGTGNTQLLCAYIAAKIKTMPLELVDATKVFEIDWKKYDVVGFACFTDSMGVPALLKKYIKKIPDQHDRPAFVLNTFGNMSGRTLPSLAQQLRKRGFNVAAGHSLHCPENFPPMIAAGHDNMQAPTPEEMEQLDIFIATLNGMLLQVHIGTPLEPAHLTPGFPDTLAFPLPRTSAKWMMGKKMVDKERCTTCGICKKGCPYGAISMTPHPTFDETLCAGCWRCYNRCPEEAIHTKKYYRKALYAAPPDVLKKKLTP